MPNNMSANELFVQVMIAHRDWVEHNDDRRFELVRIDFDRWVDERTEDSDKFTRTYIKALYVTTVLSPFASDIYNYSWQELKEMLENIEASWKERN